MNNDLKGIYAAVVTPFDENGNLLATNIQAHLKNLADRGCHGVLVSGTTGEGPSLSVQERIDLLEVIRSSDVNLRVLAGTGAASLMDAVQLTRVAFDIGCDAVVIIPPFFFPDPSTDGLYDYYHIIIEQAVPADGAVLLYNNPMVSAPVLTLELVRRLRDRFPDQVIGIKDSSQSLENAQELIELDGFQVFVGDDRLLSRATASGGAGAMTSMANLFPDMLRAVFDSTGDVQASAESQARLDGAYKQLHGVARIPAIKKLLAASRLLDYETVRPPLTRLSPDETEILNTRFHLHLKVPDEIDLELLLGKDAS